MPSTPLQRGQSGIHRLGRASIICDLAAPLPFQSSPFHLPKRSSLADVRPLRLVQETLAQEVRPRFPCRRARDEGPWSHRLFSPSCFPYSYAAAPSNYPTRVPKGAARVTQRRANDIGATRRRGNPQRKETGAKAPLDALLVPPIIQQTLMGMGSPENRRKADGSYQAQGVGRGFFCSQLRLRKGGQWLGFLFP